MMRLGSDRRGWVDLGLGFVLGLVATGIVVAGFNALMGWHRVGVWERAIKERHVEDLEALMLSQIDLSKEGLKDQDPLILAQRLAFTGANLGGTRWNAERTERLWLVGTQGLDHRAIRDLRANGGIFQKEELLNLIDPAIILGFRTQIDEDAEISGAEREAVFYDLLRQYWMQ